MDLNYVTYTVISGTENLDGELVRNENMYIIGLPPNWLL